MRFDSETLFNTAAAAVSTIAVILFVLDNQFPYSPVTKTMLVVAFLGGVFAVSQRTEDYQLTLLGYAVVVISTVVLFLDLMGTFDVGTTGRVLGLLALAMVLFGVRTRLDSGARLVSGERATQAFAALVVLAAVVVAVDVISGGLAYELQTQQEVRISGDREPGAQLGTVVVTNPGPLPQRIDMPQYDVCTAGDWSDYRIQRDGEQRPVDAHLRVDRQYGEHLFGFGEREYAAVVQIRGTNVSGEQFLVQQTEGCPTDESGDPYIAVFERSEDRRYRTPV